MWLYMPKQRPKPLWSTCRTKPISYPILHDFAVVKVLGTLLNAPTRLYTIYLNIQCSWFILSKFGWFSNVFHPHFVLFLHHWPPATPQRRDPRQDQTIEVHATRTRWAPKQRTEEFCPPERKASSAALKWWFHEDFTVWTTKIRNFISQNGDWVPPKTLEIKPEGLEIETGVIDLRKQNRNSISQTIVYLSMIGARARLNLFTGSNPRNRRG